MNRESGVKLVDLHVFGTAGITLEDAVRAADCLHDGKAVALVYELRSCRFARIAADGSLQLPGRDSTLLGPYEVRAFNETAELRWIGDPSTPSLGTAVLLSEVVDHPPQGWSIRQVQRGASVSGTTYVLWGTARAVSPDWATLFEHRVGELPVPVAGLKEGENVVLKALEYISEDDPSYGNMAVTAERLIGLYPEGRKV